LVEVLGFGVAFVFADFVDFVDFVDLVDFIDFIDLDDIALCGFAVLFADGAAIATPVSKNTDARSEARALFKSTHLLSLPIHPLNVTDGPKVRPYGLLPWTGSARARGRPTSARAITKRCICCVPS
jgi:hypothetical protein